MIVLEASDSVTLMETAVQKKRNRVRVFLGKAVLFMALLLVLDHAIGAILTHGLKTYFGLQGSASVLCIGHSRMVLGIDSGILEEKLQTSVAKYTVRGADTAERFAMVRHFLTENPDVRLLVYDVESTSFAGSGLSSNSYRLFYPFMDNPEMAAYIQQQLTSSLDFRLRQLLRTSRFDEVTVSLALRGLTGMSRNLKMGTFDPDAEKRRIARGRRRAVSVEPTKYEVFLDTLEFARGRGVQIVLVHMPTVDILNRFDSENRRRVRQMFADLASQTPSIHFIDFSTAFESDHDLFFDAIHVNAKGQTIVSHALADEIRKLPIPPTATKTE